MTKPEAAKQLSSAVADFYNAAVTLLRVWEQSTSNEIFLDEAANADPFNGDAFEDVVYKIGKWSEAVSSELSKEYPDTNVN